MLIQQNQASQAPQPLPPSLCPSAAARYTHKSDQSSIVTKAGESPGCLSKLFSFLTWPVRKIWEILCGLCCCSKKQEEQKEPPIDYKNLFLTDPEKAVAALLDLKSAEEFIVKLCVTLTELDDQKSTYTDDEKKNAQKSCENLMEKIRQKVEGPATAISESTIKKIDAEICRMFRFDGVVNLILKGTPPGDRVAKMNAEMDQIKASLKDDEGYSYILTYFKLNKS